MSDYTDAIFNTELTNLQTNGLINSALGEISENKSFSIDYEFLLGQIVSQLITKPRREWSPHINGWYYVNMVHGTWTNYFNKPDAQNSYREFSPNAYQTILDAKKHMGHLIKDIDPTQMNAEYETVSGKLRNVHYATKLMSTNEFSITYKDDRNLTMFRYHEQWYKYIEAYKKGFITTTESTNAWNSSDIFIDMPYLNAVWIAIFKPFTYELLGLVKIMGVTPTGLPVKEIIGQRSNPQVTTYTVSYKATDTITYFFDPASGAKPSGNFYSEFKNASTHFF